MSNCKYLLNFFLFGCTDLGLQLRWRLDRGRGVLRRAALHRLDQDPQEFRAVRRHLQEHLLPQVNLVSAHTHGTHDTHTTHNTHHTRGVVVNTVVTCAPVLQMEGQRESAGAAGQGRGARERLRHRVRGRQAEPRPPHVRRTPEPPGPSLGLHAAPHTPHRTRRTH